MDFGLWLGALLLQPCGRECSVNEAGISTGFGFLLFVLIASDRVERWVIASEREVGDAGESVDCCADGSDESSEYNSRKRKGKAVEVADGKKLKVAWKVRFNSWLLMGWFLLLKNRAASSLPGTGSNSTLDCLATFGKPQIISWKSNSGLQSDSQSVHKVMVGLRFYC